MLFAALMAVGSALGLVMGALAHPKIYAFVFRKAEKSADHSPFGPV